jgi:hypothetical protein
MSHIEKSLPQKKQGLFGTCFKLKYHWYTNEILVLSVRADI